MGSVCIKMCIFQSVWQLERGIGGFNTNEAEWKEKKNLISEGTIIFRPLALSFPGKWEENLYNFAKQMLLTLCRNIFPTEKRGRSCLYTAIFISLVVKFHGDGWGTWGQGLMKHGGAAGWGLDLMALKLFSNLNNSIILYFHTLNCPKIIQNQS